MKNLDNITTKPQRSQFFFMKKISGKILSSIKNKAVNVDNFYLKFITKNRFDIGYWFQFYIFVKINITDEIYSFEW